MARCRSGSGTSSIRSLSRVSGVLKSWETAARDRVRRAMRSVMRRRISLNAAARSRTSLGPTSGTGGAGSPGVRVLTASAIRRMGRVSQRARSNDMSATPNAIRLVESNVPWPDALGRFAANRLKLIQLSSGRRSETSATWGSAPVPITTSAAETSGASTRICAASPCQVSEPPPPGIALFVGLQ